MSMCNAYTGQDLLQSHVKMVKGRTYVNSFPQKLHLHNETQDWPKKIAIKKCLAKSRDTVDPKIFVKLYFNLNSSCVVLL